MMPAADIGGAQAAWRAGILPRKGCLTAEVKCCEYDIAPSGERRYTPLRDSATSAFITSALRQTKGPYQETVWSTVGYQNESQSG